MTSDKAKLQLLGDRAAWLRQEDQSIRNEVLTDPEAAARYWSVVEASAGWAGHVLARRAREVRLALIGKRRKRR